MRTSRARGEQAEQAEARQSARGPAAGRRETTGGGAAVPPPLSADVLRAAQRGAGNGAVTGMIARRARTTPAPEQQQDTGVHEVLRSAGKPLAGPVRQEMESRFGTDFSDVRMHTGPSAARSARAIGARAYTSGSHVVIGDGGGDKHTVAHELTHVVQQRQGPVAGTDNGSGLRISDPSDRFEREAESNAHRVLAGPVPAGTRERTAETTAESAHRTDSVQRFTDQDVPGVGGMRISNSGAFAIVDGAPEIWVRHDARNGIAPALVNNNEQTQINGSLYHRYSLGGPVLNQCLHVAEEIINNRVNALEHGTDASVIDTYSKAKGDREEFFGAASDGTNRRMARQYPHAKDEAANPQVNQAFVIIALKPGDQVMSQFHAAAVVARDGDDCVTLEAFAGAEEQLEDAAARMYTVNGGADSFHGYWTGEEMYYHGVSATTVVIRPALVP
ncbi:DUF4157 domain-containing protein [Streptomyces collinus]|uniref:eCIS core domain-containing protein n=1 Tax=Streptomyces collinus TaxID=42684 RepID=UPI002941D792|nr:DUF4157 domain-containing protein [Streptomyces collinus]